jgi:oligosaccharide 4-alpha-D-glucosyltransferase
MTLILRCLVTFLAVTEATAQTFLGDYTGHARQDGSVVVRAESSSLRLTFYTPDIVRVDCLFPGDSVPDSSFTVVAQPEHGLAVTLDERDSVLVVSAGGVKVRIGKYPVRLQMLDSANAELLSEPSAGGMGWRGARRILRFTMNDRMHFYGTGERGTALDRRGQRFESYNRQIGGYAEPLPTMNLNVPFTATSAGFGLFVDNTWKGEWDFGASDPSLFSYTSDGGAMSFYVVAGPTVPRQLAEYTWLTGRQPLPPRWALGFIQSKNRYETSQEAREIVRTMREKSIPCDAIVLDLKWFEHMGDISWNDSTWPDHEQMVSDFLGNGIKTILITEPYLVEPSRNFDEALARGFLASDSTGRPFMLERWWSCMGGCRAALLDMTNPEAREWWWGKHPAAFGKAVAGIWTDLGEPERHPAGMMHHLGPAEQIHNIYNLLWSRLVFEGFSRLRPDGRVMNLTRSGFAGIQRYGVLPWSGDVARSFGGLQVQLPMLLNMGMSGLAYHNSDIGGYARNETSPELYVRWMQFGTFCPIARAHGAGETVRGFPTEPWRFGPEAERICREFITLRYRLLPYLYTMAHDNFVSGMPLARPLSWLDPDDSVLANESSSYMWGDALLVSPVVTPGEMSKDVYLPHGSWINFWTDEAVTGGRTVTVASPLDRMPLFVKGGSLLPTAPVMQYSDERPLDTVTVLVYPGGNAESSYTLYEDDGTSLGYQRGECSTTEITRNVEGEGGKSRLKLQVGPVQGRFKGMLEERTYRFEVHGVNAAPEGVTGDGSATPTVSYEGTRKVLLVTTRVRAEDGGRVVVTLPVERKRP